MNGTNKIKIVNILHFMERLTIKLKNSKLSLLKFI
jgi:hypothetical protein